MRNALKMCLNWKVLVGLGVAGLVLWAVAPNLVSSALPVLLFLACPLSMLLMMRGMQGDMRSQEQSTEAQVRSDPSDAQAPTVSDTTQD